ncbi:MAG: pentapeptide repeat-containing protein [Candidatus Roizmanbacteria bacterium]|nr:pentapeptide repeat-containing protein [Candidatus Roizmanbacteria bacterium]
MNLLSKDEESFYKETFTGIVYSSAKIQNKEFENCVFDKCTFIECTFDACKFIDCIFSNCSISAAKPYNSQFFNVTFIDSKIMGFDWTKTKTVRELIFKKCDISYSNFSYIKLHSLKLIECIAKEVNFNEADLTEGIFTQTDFSLSIFSNTNLTKTDFRRAINYGIDIKFNILKKAKFSLPEATSLLRSLDIILEI